MGVGVDEGAVPKHRANGGFVVVMKHGGSCDRVGHGEVIERYVLLADGVVDVRMFEEEGRRELVDLFIGDVGGVRDQRRYEMYVWSRVRSTVLAMLARRLRLT